MTCSAPHATAACTNGACAIVTCASGYANCNGVYADGCEADLSSPATCGNCYTACYPNDPVCVLQNGYHMCGPSCAAPLPDACYYTCTDFKTDPANCGGCGHGCYLPNAVSGCSQGQCTLVRCSDIAFADCTSDPGCETQLGTLTNCAGCGDACSNAHGTTACAYGVFSNSDVQ